MVPSEISSHIANMFSKYVRTEDKSLIENFDRDEIEFALLQYSRDKEADFYIAMQKRIDELKENENEQKSNREKWKDRLIGFIFALALGLILYWLTK